MSKEDKVSSYTILNRWLYDGSTSTKIPEEIEKDKSISQMYILYYFRPSPYGLVISKLLNNWGIFSLDRLEVFQFMKQCIMLTGYKPPFIQKVPAKKNKISGMLKEKYPYLKNEEIFMMIDIIDKSDEKDRIYEMFGIYSPSKKKLTKAQKEKFVEDVKVIKENQEKEYDLNKLMENFQ